MQADNVDAIRDLTPRLRRRATLQLRYYRGMSVMHMERFRELEREFWEAMAEGDLERTRRAYQDARAMTNEAMRLLRLQQLTRRRLVMLGGAVEVARVAPMAPNARSSPPGSDDDTPDESS